MNVWSSFFFESSSFISSEHVCKKIGWSVGEARQRNDRFKSILFSNDALEGNTIYRERNLKFIPTLLRSFFFSKFCICTEVFVVKLIRRCPSHKR